MKEITYTFIIPHHNCPELLDRCLNSIPKRTDIQIVVVDDNSDEEKRPVECGRPSVEYIYISKEESKGAGRARNVGILSAKGKWLIFADADDYYTDNLNTLLDKYSHDDDTDLVYINAHMVDQYGNSTPFVISSYIRNYQEKKIYSEHVLRYNIWSPWTRMVKRHLVEQYAIFFDSIPMGNDMMFSLKCSKYAKCFKVEEMIIYSYFNPIGRSVTENNRCKIENIKYKIELAIRQNELYSSVGYVFRSSFITGLRNIPKGTNTILYKDEYKKKLKEYKINYLKDLYYTILYRIALTLKILK